MSSSIEKLVNAFNLNNYFSDNVYTNFTVDGEKIVGLFAKDTDVTEYLRGIREEIIKQQYPDGEGVAGKYYNLNCFPFILNINPSRGKSNVKGIVKVKLAGSKDKEVIRNLEIHLVNEFRRAVTLKLIARLQKVIRITEEEAHEWAGNTVKIGAFDRSNPLKKDYLYCIAFDDGYLEREGYDSETFELFKGMYIQEFNSRLKECGLKNSDFYDYKDDVLYIKNVSDKVVENVAKYVKGQIALSFEAPGEECSKVENFKNVLGGLIFKWTGKSINAYEHDIFTDEKEIEKGNSFVLIPLTKVHGDQLESLKRTDMYNINTKYKNLVGDIKGKTADQYQYIASYKNPVYGISNKKIVKLIPEIMQSPIAYNKELGCFEFAADLGPSSRIDLESPRQGSVLSSVPAAEGTRVADAKNNPDPSMSGQNPDEDYDYMQDSSQSVNTRDPSDAEEMRKRRHGCNLSIDSALSGGTGDSGVYSSQEFLNGDIDNEKEPSYKLSQMKLGSPQRDQGKELKRVPRLESEEGGLQSSGYQLSTQLSFTKVSGSQSQQSVSAAYNVQAGTNMQPQQMNPWLQQGTHENKWSQSLQPGPSGLSQQRPSLWPQGGHSSTTSAWSQPMDPWSLPALSGNIPGFLLPTQVDSMDTPLTEKEEELIKALLYAFNLNNYILECPNTNFIVENGKIASSINNGVNVKEYLQELRDYTIKEYCSTEEKAKEEGYDLNKFPFKFLSNCETNQEITVVANISHGALLNLKKLFIRHEQGVKIEGIDINTVENAVEFQKNIWVDSQVKGGYCSPQAAIESCYPDESVLKDIPIIKGEDGYYLDRIYGTFEVESFMEKRLHAKDTSKAEKMKPEDNKDSGYSSEPVTDAEKGEKSPKCRSQSPVGRGSPEKSLRRDSSTLDAANLIQQPDISKSDRFSDKSSKEGFPDTGGGINMQYTGARKKITGESDICSANPWAVPGTAFVLDSVSHVKSNIDKLGEDFLGAIKVTEEGKFDSSKLEPRHQWLDRERHRRSTKQATEEESISNWVWE